MGAKEGEGNIETRSIEEDAGDDVGENHVARGKAEEKAEENEVTTTSSRSADPRSATNLVERLLRLVGLFISRYGA